MIYFISSPQTDKIYFGSTIKTAEQRFSHHKCSYKRWLEGKGNNNTSFEIIQFGDAVLTVLEEVEDKEDMLIGEAFYIRNFPCVNKCIPLQGRKNTIKKYDDAHREQKKTYREEHKEQHNIRQKRYQDAHRDELNARRRAKYLLNRNLVPVMEQPLTVGINE